MTQIIEKFMHEILVNVLSDVITYVLTNFYESNFINIF